LVGVTLMPPASLAMLVMVVSSVYGTAGAGWGVFADGAGDADFVADLHGADIAGRGEHKHAVRGQRIAVAVRVLEEEAGADLGRDHAFGGLHAAGVRAGIALALDLRNGVGDAGRCADRHADRAAGFLRLVVAELDGDRIGAGLDAGCHVQAGGGDATRCRRRLEVDQADAAPPPR
jgi:hypothetical protein